MSEERLLQAVRAAGLGIFDHNRAANTVEWSSELRKILGIGADEVASLSDWIAHVYPEDRDGIGEAIRQAHNPAGDGLYSVEYRVVRPLRPFFISLPNNSFARSFPVEYATSLESHGWGSLMNQREAVQRVIRYVTQIACELQGDKGTFFHELSFHLSELAEISENHNSQSHGALSEE